MKKMPIFSPAVQQAQQNGAALVALESAVITHGLPRPENLQLARALEQEVVACDAVPATIAMMRGALHVGLTAEQLEVLANQDADRKISVRDFGIAAAQGLTGGTTVAATLAAAHQAGISVFATGGIGGVHRGYALDVSADLPELGRRPLVVVCAGAKAILDLPATREMLETQGVPVIGYGTDEFPAFYSSSSGLKVDVRCDSPLEIARIALAHWNMGMNSALLVVQPPPAEVALAPELMEAIISQALEEANQAAVRGAEVTPFLLRRVSELSGGESLRANLALLRNNARLAAAIAVNLNRLATSGA